MQRKSGEEGTTHSDILCNREEGDTGVEIAITKNSSDSEDLEDDSDMSFPSDTLLECSHDSDVVNNSLQQQDNGDVVIESFKSFPPLKLRIMRERA